MTEQMAIEHIRNLAGDYKCWDDKISHEESLILCKLLDKLEQYRALGTIEQIKTLQDDYWTLNEMCKDYYSLGTVEELRVARDKQVAKKPVLVTRGIIKFYPCPNADCSNPNKYIRVYPNQKYCVYCGQKLDWSDEE